MILFILFSINSHANQLDDLIKSQDAIVKQHMPQVQDFINQANKNAAKYQLSAESIIKNSKTNCQAAANFDWLHDVAVTEQSVPPTSELYVFASLSLPKTRLIELIKEATKYNGAVVLRGLKNNSYKDTALFLQPIIEQAGAGFIIDPTLFTQYNITKVPVFVLNDPLVKQHDKITGNIGVEYALQEFAKNGDLKNTAGKILEAAK